MPTAEATCLATAPESRKEETIIHRVVSATGKGEEFIRHGVARELAALVAHAGMTPEQAAKKLVFETLKPGDGGLIALGRDGSIVLLFNTEGMVRAPADTRGRFETAIW